MTSNGVFGAERVKQQLLHMTFQNIVPEHALWDGKIFVMKPQQSQLETAKHGIANVSLQYKIMEDFFNYTFLDKNGCSKIKRNKGHDKLLQQKTHTGQNQDFVSSFGFCEYPQNN